MARPIVFMSDSKTTVEWVNGKATESGSQEKTIRDICSWLVSFSQSGVEFCPRNSNSFADSLAKYGSVPSIKLLCWSDVGQKVPADTRLICILGSDEEDDNQGTLRDLITRERHPKNRYDRPSAVRVPLSSDQARVAD
ncbi:hypothetical protein LWI29_022895 [Acer saccharum]|uniref:RNase H type-1 domain-containing protein n=1 Tax=Acer saccharum TaxID=4024 RepID=A0AA39RY47_ACESA|nr:hypothetical protein LWI29_022895 [Acer saccharum]